MSSFVIAKREYVKAAGFLAAVVDCENYYREPALRLWHKREQRLYTAADVWRDMCRLFEINAAAVAKQYGDESREADPSDYEVEFAATFEAGKQLLNKGYRLHNSGMVRETQRVIYCVIQFFKSALYQIEDEENHRRALRIMNKYFRGLYDVLQALDYICNDDCDCWGRFDALDPEEEGN